MKRAIKNCDCCWAAAAAAAAVTPPRMLHVPMPDDTIGSEDDDAIGASREPVALSVIIELDCWEDALALAAALLPPVAFVAEDTAGCCWRRGNRSNCWRAALKVWKLKEKREIINTSGYTHHGRHLDSKHLFEHYNQHYIRLVKLLRMTQQRNKEKVTKIISPMQCRRFYRWKQKLFRYLDDDEKLCITTHLFITQFWLSNMYLWLLVVYRDVLILIVGIVDCIYISSSDIDCVINVTKSIITLEKNKISRKNLQYCSLIFLKTANYLFVQWLSTSFSGLVSCLYSWLFQIWRLSIYLFWILLKQKSPIAPVYLRQLVVSGEKYIIHNSWMVDFI